MRPSMRLRPIGLRNPTVFLGGAADRVPSGLAAVGRRGSLRVPRTAPEVAEHVPPDAVDVVGVVLGVVELDQEGRPLDAVGVGLVAVGGPGPGEAEARGRPRLISSSQASATSAGMSAA